MCINTSIQDIICEFFRLMSSVDDYEILERGFKYYAISVALHISILKYTYIEV